MDIPLQDLDWGITVNNVDDVLRVGDIGCGEAEYHEELYEIIGLLAKDHGHQGEVQLYGIERDSEKLEKAREDNPDSFTYINHELGADEELDLPFDGKLDILVSQHLFCTADNPGDIVSETDKYVKDSGYNTHHSRC